VAEIDTVAAAVVRVVVVAGGGTVGRAVWAGVPFIVVVFCGVRDDGSVCADGRVGAEEGFFVVWDDF